MDDTIAVMPDNSLEGLIQRLTWMFQCMSLGRCVHPM